MTESLKFKLSMLYVDMITFLLYPQSLLSNVWLIIHIKEIILHGIYILHLNLHICTSVLSTLCFLFFFFLQITDKKKIRRLVVRDNSIILWNKYIRCGRILVEMLKNNTHTIYRLCYFCIFNRHISMKKRHSEHYHWTRVSSQES